MIFLILLFNIAFAKTPLSAIRPPHQDYKNFLKGIVAPIDPENASALTANEDIRLQPWLKITESDLDPITLQVLFEHIRDVQPLKDQSDKERRLTWLYPDDGCYARSAIAQFQLQQKGQGHFQQIFVFGNLKAATQNHPAGEVRWWYHVAPIIKTSFGAFVFDPAIDPRQPLTVERWLEAILPHPTDARVSICEPSTYSPEYLCKKDSPIQHETAEEEETNVYLDLEWSRVKSLGRDPEKELGEEPPWELNPTDLLSPKKEIL